jgi:3-hydroxyisobutyrate dehydrogenase
MSRPQLNRHLVLEHETQVPDGSGGFLRNWLALGAHWAEINAGSGRSGVSEVNFPKWVLNEDYNSGFTMGLMRKDVKLGLELTKKYEVNAPAFDTIASIWEESKNSLPDNKDFNEIYKMSKKND